MLDANNNKFMEADPLMNPSSSPSETNTDLVMSTDEDMCQPKKLLIRQTNWRWLMLACGCFFLMGSYFCYDNPAPLKNFFLAPPYDLSTAQWSAFYSIYSFPNMVLPLFGGIFIDRLGIR